MPYRRSDNLRAMSYHTRAGQHDETAAWLTREHADRAFEFGSVARRDGSRIDPKRWRQGLDRVQQSLRCGPALSIDHRHAAEAGLDLLEQLQPFSAHRQFSRTESGDIATRTRHVRYQPHLDRVTGAHKHNWDSAGLASQGIS